MTKAMQDALDAMKACPSQRMDYQGRGVWTVPGCDRRFSDRTATELFYAGFARACSGEVTTPVYLTMEGSKA